LCLAEGARWFSEALLASPFRPRRRADPLGEGFATVDAVIGHFDFVPVTKAGLRLQPDASPFVVVEAKMYSGLSSGTKNAPTYNQAARNVPCMAAAFHQARLQVHDLNKPGFYVIAPAKDRRSAANADLETNQVTRKFLNCHGSFLSMSSGNSRPRSCSGVQSLYLPTTGPR